MAQVFDRNSNALARMSLVLTGLIVISLGVALNSLQRSPWVTRQGQRPDQPIPFSHKHHVEGLGLQCQYCHTSVEKSSYAGIPPTKTCINCHSQIWTNAEMLEPVRTSWATGASINWIRVHDLPDYVYFNHEIHVNKGIGCASCHGRVDEMPLMYEENSLQMEWCLNCHRNPAQNLRPTSEIYNMAWAGPSRDQPVWCAGTGKNGPTAQQVTCTTNDPNKSQAEGLQRISLNVRTAGMGQELPGSGTRLQPHPLTGKGATISDTQLTPASYQQFTNQMDLGRFLTDKYHIRTGNELSSCEVCHR
jgi:Cytochrome c7 and related cytochrome c